MPSKDSKDAMIGCLAVIVMIGLCGVFYALPKNSTLKKAANDIVEAIPTIAPTVLPTPIPTIAQSDILGNKMTLESIFEVLKKGPVTSQQFNGLFSMAGVQGLPNPPNGWQYYKNKDGGIGLKKAEELSKKVR